MPIVVNKIDVARMLILHAKQGVLSIENNPEEILRYQKSCETYYSPTQTTLALTRDILPVINVKAWHLSISFTDRVHGLLPFREEVAKEWVQVVFGQYADKAVILPGITDQHIRHYILLCGSSEFVEL